MTESSVSSEEYRSRNRGRVMFAALLTLALVAPLAGVGPASALHQPQDDVDPEKPESAQEALDSCHPPDDVEPPEGVPEPPPGTGCETDVLPFGFWRQVRWDLRQEWTDRPLNDVHFVDQFTGYAVSARVPFGRDNDSVVLKTTDRGEEWSLIFLPAGAGDETLNGVSFISPEVGYVVGDGGTILRTTDGGKDDWTLLEITGVEADLQDVEVVEADTEVGYEVWVVGGGGTILRSVDAGANWTIFAVTVDGEAVTTDLSAVSFPTPEIGYVVGHGGTAIRTTDGGATWGNMPLPAAAVPDAEADDDGVRTAQRELRVDLWDVTFPNSDDPEKGYAVGDIDDPASPDQGAYILETDGETDGWGEQPTFHIPGAGTTLRGVAFDTKGELGQAVGALEPPFSSGRAATPLVLVREVDEETGAVWVPEPTDAVANTTDNNRVVGPRRLNATAYAGEGDAAVRVAVGSNTTSSFGDRFPQNVIVKRTTDLADLARAVEDDEDGRPRACLTGGEVDAVDAALGAFTQGTQQTPVEEQADDVAGAIQNAVHDRQCHDPPQGDPPPASTTTTTAPPPPADSACDIDARNPEFPCLREFQFADEHGEAMDNPAWLDFDPGRRRAVGYHGGRVLLYDMDRLEQRGVKGFGRFFEGESRQERAEMTGVVNLADAPNAEEMPDNKGADRLVVLDRERHILYVGLRDCSGGPNTCVRPEEAVRVVAVSLTGEFAPSIHRIDELFPGESTNRPEPAHLATHLAVDERSGMVYLVVASLQATPWDHFGNRGLTARVSLHAFAPTISAGSEESGPPVLGLERRWSLPIDEQCGDTRHRALPFMGVSRDGRTIAFGCQGAETTFTGQPQFTPSGIFTVVLPERADPASLNDVDARAGIRQFFEPAVGVMGNASTVGVVGDEDAGIVHWFAGGFNYFFDFVERMWVGTTTSGKARLGVADPGTGRLYLTGSEIGAGRLMFYEMANLPGSVGKASVPTGASGFTPQVFDGETRRLLGSGSTESGSRMLVFEDRVPPPIPDADMDPDDFTNDIDEEDANSVDRFGATAAYGTRVWWTGLAGSLPGTFAIDGDTSGLGVTGCAVGKCPRPGGTYGWLWGGTGEHWWPNDQSRRYVDHGTYTGRWPWRPHEGQREIFGARVEEAELGDTLSSATATALDVDDGSDDDVGRRRGPRDLNEMLDTHVAGLCAEFPDDDADPDDPDDQSSQEQCQEHHSSFKDSDDRARFEECALEFYDRLLREVDGDRRAEFFDEDGNPRDPCDGRFRQFDEHDPDYDEDSGENKRPGLEERLGWTRSSSCADPGGHEDSEGSTVACDHRNPPDDDTSRTEASAQAGFVVEFPGSPITMSVDATRSDTVVSRDRELGIVAEAVGLAQGVTLDVPGQGSLAIAEVRSEARAWAKGRPGTARSSHDVAIEHVVLTHPDGPVAFACGRDDVEAAGERVGVPQEFRDGYRENASGERVELPEALRDGYGENASEPLPEKLPEDPEPFPEEPPDDPACDPEAVATAINRLFGGRVVASAPERQTDEEIAGSDGGAQAIVRRNRRDYFAERALFDLRRDEVPGLSLTVIADGAVFNRYKVDLAGTFSEAQYKIGQERIESEPPPAGLAVELTDGDGAPLAGGRFEVWADRDGDGAIGAGDAALGACTTRSDGVGDCRFGSLTPGAYGVRQTAAPPGYLAQAGVASVHASPGSTSTARFTNFRDGGGVDVLLVNPDGQPLEGGAFELAHESAGTASCTTDVEGRCSFFPVPLGAYALAQQAAPQGFKTAEAISFALQRPGQVASIRVVNGLAVAGASVEIIEIIEGEPVVSTSSDEGLFGRLRDAVADAFGFLLRNPLQALLFLALFGLLFSPAYGLARRMDLIAAEEAT